MVSITLSEQERDLLVMSLKHCLETCKQGGQTGGCTDCEKIEGILKKIK